VVLLAAEELPKDAYFREVAARVGKAPDKSAFIFIHGYNVLFKDAARRTAQMAYDLNFPGAPVFYSWPSAGTVTGYTYDENNITWTEPHLRTFLKDFIASSTAQNLYLVAHSMGNRALVNVVKEIAREDPTLRTRIKEIILAAPDIDADIFKRDIAPYIVTASPTVTLYASKNDIALMASKKVHGYARIGDATDGLPVLPGIETIDSSAAETDFVGHGYYAKSIISDIAIIIEQRRRAAERPRLKAVGDGAAQRYWLFEAAKAP
jgi:esterase/lipase superfamily enzyme